MTAATEHTRRIATPANVVKLAAPLRPRAPVRPYRPARWEKAFLAALELAPVVSVAARQAGVSRSAIYARAQRHPEFKQRMLEAREVGLDAVEGALFKLALDDDVPPAVQVKACIYILERLRPEKWGRHRDRGHQGPVEIVIVDAEGRPVNQFIDRTPASRHRGRALPR